MNNLNNQVRDLQASVQRLRANNSSYFYYPQEYIKVEDNFERLLMFNGVYFKSSNFNSLAKTLERMHVTIDARTLKRLSVDETRWNELWSLGIEVVLAKQSELTGRWICSNGYILKGNLVPYAISFKHSSIYMVDGYTGEEESYNRADVVYATFIDPNYEGILYFRDGDFSNCAVYNIKPLDSTKK